MNLKDFRNKFILNKVEEENIKLNNKIKDDLLWWYKFKLDTIEEAVKVMDDEQLVKAIRKLFS